MFSPLREDMKASHERCLVARGLIADAGVHVDSRQANRPPG
jgi:hypothetical protein